jgi:uncharacterized protein YciI
MAAELSEWIYFLHAPRENFAATMTEAERAAFGRHFAYLQQLQAAGTLILAGPTLGPVNTGIAIFRAPDEAAATAIMNADPTIVDDVVKGELRPFRVSLLAGRDS